MDEVLNIVRQRRSIREFQKKEIPRDVVRKLIDALLWAPSAGNLQSRKFYLITDGALKRKLAVAALNQYFIAEAPLVVVGCADKRIGGHYGERGISLYSVQDVACSLMSMMLVACENRIANVWVGAFREAEVVEILGLPAHLRPVAIIVMGYSDSAPRAPRRVAVDDAVEFR